MEIISSIKDIAALITGAATVVIAILIYRNTQKGTPPELLNLEKWESIKSSISKNKHSYTLEDRQKVNNNFTIALYQANKSIRIDEIEIKNQSAKNDLKKLPVSWKYQRFPSPPRTFTSILDLTIGTILMILFIIFSIIFLVFSIYTLFLLNYPWALLSFTYTITFMTIAVFSYQSIGPYQIRDINTMKKGIITRNVFMAYFKIFSVDISLHNEITEDPKEAKQRAGFESKRFFQNWLRNDGKGKSSWDYGFTAETGVDNADNFDSHEPDKLAPQGYIFTPNWDEYIKNIEIWYMKNRIEKIFTKRPKRKLKKK
ncbi:MULTISPECIES: hypothetical protein [Rothia]|jgi:hypothetical protein|uniref:hypothetical protein n=1 Tax=Rothia TaxID=32207 RepID=UPI0008A61BB9|nr:MULTISPECIES: hypothetical protein [Rothia]OFP55200.1 hypothetical protein HMPREF2981_03350 [Rothia sp. HMSC069C01]